MRQGFPEIGGSCPEASPAMLLQIPRLSDDRSGGKSAGGRWGDLAATGSREITEAREWRSRPRICCRCQLNPRRPKRGAREQAGGIDRFFRDETHSLARGTCRMG